MLALTHIPSSHMDRCELTFLERASIDQACAVQQHAHYCRTLAECGVQVRTLDTNRDLPDCVFIEDTAVVLDELAILTPMGTAARRAEPAGIEPELRQYRPIQRIERPATLEGGDVLRIGRTLLVGLSARTNAAGAAALREIVRHHGYRVVPVPVHGCLHLKTACTALDERRLLVQPAWLDTTALREFEIVPVPKEEPWGANTLRVGPTVCLAAAHERTADLLRRLGFSIRPIDLSEFARAEGGVTCLSLLFAEG